MPERSADNDSLKALLELHEEPVVLIDDQYTIVAANRAYSESYSATPAQMVGNKCHRISHRSDVPCHERGEDCPVKRVMATGKPVDTLHIHFNGNAEPERVRVRGFPIQHQGRRLLAEKIQKLDVTAGEHGATRAMQQMVGSSSAFLNLLKRLVQVSAMPGSVLIQGESGVGKELAARFVHEHSTNPTGPLVVVDCTAIPATMFEAELFGHESGAIPNTSEARDGLFQSANGGTLFLDEVGELPLNLQSKLLRAIDSGEVRRLGSSTAQTVNVRIVAATNKNLQEMVSRKTFRLDLYFRLATHELTVPPVRERRDDIRALAESMIARIGHVPTPTIQHSAIELLQRLDLPGNVRELGNLIERALVFGADIGPASIRAALNAVKRDSVATKTSDSSPAGTDIASNRAYLLAQSLHRHSGNRARTAAELGVSERTVYRWMKNFCNDPNCNW
jgi:transcriptional regulator with PAS, ATPase and Fis domain